MTALDEAQTIACPLGFVVNVFTEDPEQWLTPFLRIACHDGEEEGLRGTGMTHPEMPGRRRVVLSVGTPEIDPDERRMAAPIRWVAVGFTPLPPSFDGRLELVGETDLETRIRIEGTWKGVSTSGARSKGAASRAGATVLHSLLANLRAALEEAYGSKALHAHNGDIGGERV